MIEAKETKIDEVFTESKRFVIPRYQRPYSWTRDHALQLIEDIDEAMQSNESEYFIGSVICIEREGSIYEVVDGQQRLSTLVLIFVSLKRLLESFGLDHDIDKRLASKDPYSDQPPEPRLKVRKKEAQFYQNYILQNNKAYEPENPSYTESLFINNLSTIHEYLSSKDKEYLRRIAKFITRQVYIVFVKTSDRSSSFRFFNVLNSRGLSLTTADLLKNELFEAANDSDSHIDAIEEEWTKIENNVSIENMDTFLTIHRTSMKTDRDRNLRGILKGYKRSLEDKYGNDPSMLTRHLKLSSDNYRKLLESDFSNATLRKITSFFNELGPDEWISPALAFLNRVNADHGFTLIDFEKFLIHFEKVYMHAWFKNSSKGQRESPCYSALVSINKGGGLSEILKAIYADSDHQGFIESLDKDIYEPTSFKIRLIKAVLLRLDTEMQDESVLKTYRGRITIEHILPQNASDPYWAKGFSPDEHQYWLHKLGNLTLISGAKNSSAQNSSFKIKKDIYLKKSLRTSFDITRDVCQYESWNRDTVRDRHEILKSKLISMWGTQTEPLDIF